MFDSYIIYYILYSGVWGVVEATTEYKIFDTAPQDTSDFRYVLLGFRIVSDFDFALASLIVASLSYDTECTQ